MYTFKRHNPGQISAILLVAIAAAVSCRDRTTPLASPPALGPSPTTTSTPTLQPTPSPTEALVIPSPQRQAPCLSGGSIEEQAREALANWLAVSSEEIEVVEVEGVEWPDTSLGCPEPGKAYTQVIVPGCRVVMRVNAEAYEYHSGGGQGVLCDGEGNSLISAPCQIETPTILTPPPEAPCLSGGRVEERAREALVNWLAVSSEEIEVVEVEEVEWPDTSLGCPKPGAAYFQVIVPGCRVVMQVSGEIFEYHSGGGQGVLCDEEGNSLTCAPCQ